MPVGAACDYPRLRTPLNLPDIRLQATINSWPIARPCRRSVNPPLFAARVHHGLPAFGNADGLDVAVAEQGVDPTLAAVRILLTGLAGCAGRAVACRVHPDVGGLDV